MSTKRSVSKPKIVSWRILTLSALLLPMFLISLTGCGAGTLIASENTEATAATSSSSIGGILHGGPNPIVGATISLYVTTSSYGATATPVASTTTNSGGVFSLTLPASGVACPSGSYAYVTAYQGNTGGGNNVNTLMMVPVGACSANYTTSPNVYTGPSLWIDELTTAVSAYALGSFMTVSNAGVVSIGAPPNNTATAAAGTPGSGGQSAAGLAHAFANALAIINNSTGQPKPYTLNGTSSSNGGVIPVAEINLLGNILQACVNSTGVTGTNSATANDGTGCGKLFSLVTPPQTGAAVPTNTLQAMLDLARYPNLSLNTWNTACTAAGSGTTTATSCLFNLAAPIGAYGNALASAPPDWSLAVVYGPGYGAGTGPGLIYPQYVATDYQDNVYVMNWNAATATSTNVIGMKYDGTPLFSTPSDTTNTVIYQLNTTTNGYVFGANTVASGNGAANNMLIYNTTTGAVQTINAVVTKPEAVIADPFNNIYCNNQGGGQKLRVFNYSGGTYSLNAVTAGAGQTNGSVQLAITPTYDIYELAASGTSTLSLVANTNYATLTAPPTYSSTAITTTVSGSTANAYGIAVTSTSGAYVVGKNTAGTSGEITPITKSGSGASATISGGSAAALQLAGVTPTYRYALPDGNAWIYTADGESGISGTTSVGSGSGFDVYDTVDSLALGPYRGCYVSGTVCGTSATTVPVTIASAVAIDSSGDVWITSAGNGNLVEFIGAAAPTWPGLSMALTGKPQ